ncbi:hypothetical protein BCF74_12423 [Knoellia remsis]|uniref:Uncharacterized protein n=1 Tax=Knoellia remsis TaxID=407159 RepID=A0A2T0U9V4_9MICO|nr:hypothetical protein [Knoellia remsis]PRY54689.1 hypothetical protein BCF74_12423 [Knoellia remsis]
MTLPLSTSSRVLLERHDALAHGTAALAERVATGHAARPWGPVLREVAAGVCADRAGLVVVLEAHGITPSPLRHGTVRALERAGRWVPNGSLLSRTVATDILELEGLASAVRAMTLGFCGLQRQLGDAPLTVVDVISRSIARGWERECTLGGVAMLASDELGPEAAA